MAVIVGTPPRVVVSPPGQGGGGPGPQGPKGDPGNPGAQGPQGNQGLPGVAGRGVTAVQINQAGELLVTLTDSTVLNVGAVKGATGSQGPAGTPGPAGNGILSVETNVNDELVIHFTEGGSTNLGAIRGPQGAVGPQGPTGDPGSQGPAGASGATGPAGPKGDTGARGQQGPQGLQGPTGAQGAGVSIAGSVANQGALPSNLGSSDAGKGYLAQDTGLLYVWTGSSFSPGVQFKGDKGDTGATGAAGPKGDTGTAGATGPAGATGATGPKGDTGSTGPQGPQGLTGAQGIQGAKGDTGTAGATGPAGSTGAQGLKGDTGTAGAVDLKKLDHWSTTDSGELATSTPIATSNPTKTVIYSIELPDAAAGDLLQVAGDMQVTNPYTYNALFSTQIVLANLATDTAGLEITEAAGTNVTPDMHHLQVARVGTLTVPGSTRRFVNFVGWSAASQAQPGHALDIDQDYGKLSVIRHRQNASVLPNGYVQGPPGSPGADGATTVEGLTDATTVGKAVAKASTATVARTALGAVGKGEIVLNADDYGVGRDGTADDTAALTALFDAAAAAAKSASVFGATVSVYLRGGRYIDSASRVFATRITIRGDGPQQTILYRKSGATGDYLTFNGAYSGIEGVTIDGNRSGASSSTDAIVLNAYRTYVQNTVVVKAKGNGITVGKASAALGHRLTGIGVGQCAGYGIQVVAASGSTDGMWSDLDIGQCGLSGVRISNGAQNLSNVHTWGNGLESATDNHGFHLDSATNVLVNPQAETNLGSGIYVAGSASTSNVIIGSKLWGNVGNGLRIFSAVHGSVIGGAIYRNGVTNSSGTTSVSFAGIQVDTGTDWSFSGVHVWDDTAAVGAGDYSGFGTAPTYPFPGKASGALTQPYAYAETGTANNNTLVANQMRKEQTRSGIALLIVGNDDRIPSGTNHFGAVGVPTQTVSSGAVRIPAISDHIIVSSNAAITSVAGGYSGRVASIQFTAASPGLITSSATLRLAGGANWTPTQYAMLTLRHDGTGWIEVGRSTGTAAEDTTNYQLVYTTRRDS